MRTRDEDSVREIFIANTHSTLLVFTTHGWVYGVPVYQIPEVRRDARGRPVVNLVRLEPGDEVPGVSSRPRVIVSPGEGVPESRARLPEGFTPQP